MSSCRFPNCPRPAVVLLNLADIGPRAACATHRAWAEEIGMSFTESRSEPVVETRPAWIRRGLAKDLTGGLR